MPSKTELQLVVADRPDLYLYGLDKLAMLFS